jgi:molybdopterin-guanine dinucleotide biosynthesis protein A
MLAGTAGYVLVGGRSSRFGSDKALALWRGRPLAVWVAEQVRAAAGSVVLVGSRERYQRLGLPVIADAVEDFGPLAGLSAALEHTSAGWNLVVACDMPHLTPAFLAYLLRLAADGDADVLLPLDPEGRAEPLCAVYSSQCRGVIADAVRGGVHKMTDAFVLLHVRKLPFQDYADFDPQGRLFANLNTPADLAGAKGHG